MVDDEASADTLAAAPGAHLATLDVASAGGELAAKARLPIVAREVYEMLGEFARGGLGRIVRARDTRTGRLVAIKEMLRGQPEAAARFEREAVVTANLMHPAIVPVYEVGRWPDGEPFFAMKLVNGRSLADAVAATTSPAERLALLPHVIAVADALAYAHAQGWIHRDLKPANVLVGDHGETVVIDWGLARRANDIEAARTGDADGDDAAHTIAGAVLGTPAYMAPEQASGETVDERADVYAIGAMMRHLLTGSPAFADSKDVRELLQRVRTVAPPALAIVAPTLPADLVAIVERAMAREPEARYPTAGALAEDLRRFTTGRLVAAHRYTRLERLRRFARRNRSALAVAAVALTAAIVYGGWSLQRIVGERDRARAATARAEAATAEADRQRTTATARLATLFADRGRLELLDGRPQRALPYLAEAMRLGEDTPALRFVVARALEQVDRVVVRWPVNQLVYARLAVDGDDVIVLDKQAVYRRALDGTVRWRHELADAAELILVGDNGVAVAVPGGVVVLDAATGAVRSTLRASGPEVPGLTASPEGNVIVAGYADGKVDRWELAKGDEPMTFDTGAPADFPRALGGGRLIVGGRSTNRDVATTAWDLRTGMRVAELCPATRRCPIVAAAADGSVALGQVTGNLGGVDHVELLDATGKRVRGFELRTAAIHLALTGDAVVVLSQRNLDGYGLDGAHRWSVVIGNGGTALAVTPDGTRAVAATVTGEHTVVDVATGLVIARQAGAHSGFGVELSRSGDRVLGVGLDHRVTVWNVGRPSVMPITPTQQRTWRITFANAITLVAGTDDGVVSIRDVATGAERRRIQAHAGAVLTAQVFPALGLITSGGDGTACQWELATGAKRTCWTHGARVRRAEPSPDARSIATAGNDGSVKVWDVTSGELRTTWSLPRPVVTLRWSPDGTAIAAIDEAGNVVVHEAATGTVLTNDPGPGGNLFAGVSLEFSPDGTQIAAGRRGVRQYLLGTSDRKRDVLLEGGDGLGLVFGVAFSPDGRLVANTGTDQHLHVWDVGSGRSLHELDIGAEMHALAWSPDGAVVVTGGADRFVHAWDPDAGVELARLDARADVYTLQFAPASDALAVGTDAPTALLWRLPRFAGTADELAATARCHGLWRLDGEQLVAAEPGVCATP